MPSIPEAEKPALRIKREGRLGDGIAGLVLGQKGL
jgi:hypothetical protein